MTRQLSSPQAGLHMPQVCPLLLRVFPKVRTYMKVEDAG